MYCVETECRREQMNMKETFATFSWKTHFSSWHKILCTTSDKLTLLSLMDRYLTRFARELERSTRVIKCHFITCCINIYAVFEKSYFK
jgi:hypothetical protein